MKPELKVGSLVRCKSANILPWGADKGIVTGWIHDSVIVVLTNGREVIERSYNVVVLSD